jgi:endonuclease I
LNALKTGRLVWQDFLPTIDEEHRFSCVKSKVESNEVESNEVESDLHNLKFFSFYLYTFFL